MNDAIRVNVQQLPHAEGLALPAYQSSHAAGLDLLAAVPEQTPVVLAPSQHAMIPTGLVIALPDGYEAQVRPRSGLAARNGITIINAPGTVDADYRGEIQVVLVNLSREPFTIERGQRIAQLIVAPVLHAKMIEMKTLNRTERGTKGFGSTGRDPIDKRLK